MVEQHQKRPFECKEPLKIKNTKKDVMAMQSERIFPVIMALQSDTMAFCTWTNKFTKFDFPQGFSKLLHGYGTATVKKLV